MRKALAIGFLLAVTLVVAQATVPAYIPVYPGAEVIAEEQEEDGGTLQLVVQGKTPLTIANWYFKELKVKGWTQLEKSSGDEEYIEISAYYPKLKYYLLVSVALGDEDEVEVYCEWGPEEIENNGEDEDENGYGDENE